MDHSAYLGKADKTVVRISGGGVRIGIEAPKELPVVREELKLAMDQNDAVECDEQPAVESKA